MLDENLPTFLLKVSPTNPKQSSTFYLTQHGSDAEPSYALRYPDPDLPTSKNRYAIALYDAHNPDVLFAEVLLAPDWTQPSLSADAIRLNGGVAPPPTPVLPGEFVVQLYNPDQQVKVKHKPGSWGSAPTWEFEMPQQTFREPSTSTIDRTQNDPAASELTPRIGFKWKKDSKFAKDLACFLSGKTVNDDGSKLKNKEPDITVAIFHALKQVTLYEPNLQRVEIEDMKGFEVVLLLSAVVIRDVYFGPIEQSFRISGHAGRRKTSTSTSLSPSAAVPGLGSAKTTGPAQQRSNGSSVARPTADVSPAPNQTSPTDPRGKREIDAEAVRLKKEAEAEERERKRRDSAEQKRIKRMLEAEEKEKQRRQAEVDKETERLRRIYGTPAQPARSPLTRPILGTQHYPRLSLQPPGPLPWQHDVYQHAPPQMGWGRPPPGRPSAGPYLSAPGGYPSQSGFFSQPGPGPQPKLKEKKSFWGFKRENDSGKLNKKRSSMF